MARIVSTQIKASFGAVIRNYYEENNAIKSEINEIYPGDLVNDLSFVKDGTVIKLSGRISDVDVVFGSATVNTDVSNDFLAKDAKVNTITLDHSETNNGAIDVIPAKEIVDFNTTKEVVKVTVEPTMRVFCNVALSDGSSSENTFKVGDYLFNVTIIGKGTETTSDYKVVAFAYSLINNKVKVNGMVLNNGKTSVAIPFEAIKVCGKEGLVINDATEVEAAIEKAMSDESVGGVVLSNVTYENAIEAKTIDIVGNNATVLASSGSRCTDTIAKNETVFKGTLSVQDGADVVISGVTFTTASPITIKGAETVTFKNCKFVDVQPTASKSYYITGNASTTPVLYQFEGCYFGNNPVTETGKQYNLFELNSTVADGSYIKNCYFAKNACTHNSINIYEVEDNSTIEIANNVFEYSANAIRIGIKGNKTTTINVHDNTYLETDSEVAYAGLILVQPYGKVTESFENVTILMDNNINKSGVDQMIYMYCGGGDTQITKETQPKVYINGVLTSLV